MIALMAITISNSIGCLCGFAPDTQSPAVRQTNDFFSVGSTPKLRRSRCGVVKRISRPPKLTEQIRHRPVQVMDFADAIADFAAEHGATRNAALISI
jgi:hypothetical protein